MDAIVVDSLVAKCVARTTEALKSCSPCLTDFQRGQLSLIFHSLRHTHNAIRDLLRHETRNPISANSMPLVRVQMEDLFAVSLIVEQPRWLDVYVKDGWKALYVEHLIAREEWSALPRVVDDLNKQEGWLELMRRISSVKNEEKATIELEELGAALPEGYRAIPIVQFPTPGKSLRLIGDAKRKLMLSRLYLEYRHLCTFVHASPGPRTIQAILDPNPAFPVQATPEQLYEVFQRTIAIPAIGLDLLCIVQACTEMIVIYPSDIELRRVLEEAWRKLTECSLLGSVIWDIRAREMVGMIGSIKAN